MTVRLDADFDSKIGTTCDAELQRYFETFLDDTLKGRMAVAGGAHSIKAILSASNGVFIIPKPRRGTLQDFTDRAIGAKAAGVRFESFTGDVVDSAKAFTSIIHSAFLVLYHAGEQNVFTPTFHSVRVLLKKAVDGMLTHTDYETIRDMVDISVAFPPEGLEGKTVTVNDCRGLYDLSFAFGDGLVEDFPIRCISNETSQWLVTLPYSGSLRARVRFPYLSKSTVRPPRNDFLVPRSV